jgi:hypothetical protein
LLTIPELRTVFSRAHVALTIPELRTVFSRAHVALTIPELRTVFSRAHVALTIPELRTVLVGLIIHNFKRDRQYNGQIAIGQTIIYKMLHRN